MQIKSTPLLVNGILYFTAPNNVWAADARTGRELWHYQYPPNTGSTIGNRGVGMYGNWLFFESPDSNLVSLDAQDRQRALESIRSPTQAGLHVHSRARGGRATTSSSASAAIIWTIPVSSSRAIPSWRAAMEVVDHPA